MMDYLPPPPEELAWAAGLFEGEGCVTVYQGNVRLIVQMTDQDVIRHLQRVVGGWVSGPHQSPSRGNRKPFWAWQVGKCAEVHRVAHLLWPWLGRRRQARLTEFGLGEMDDRQLSLL